MAHGFSTLLHAPTGFGVALRKYTPKKGDTWHCTEITLPMPELERRANQAVETAQAAVEFIGKLFLHYHLEQVEFPES